MKYTLHNKYNKINPLLQYIGIFYIILIILYLLAGLYIMAAGSRKITENPAALQEGLSDKLLRFHVIGNSDSIEDQAVKLLVKEEITTYLRPLLSSASSKEEAGAVIVQHLDAISSLAAKKLSNEGYAYSASASLSPAFFPIKSYEDVTLPEGMYDALVVKLGEAKGKNWWCIMFPQLCFVEGSVSIVPDFSKSQLQFLLTEEEYAAILNEPKKITYQSKLWEWLKKIF